MADKDEFSDDYIAGLLAKDAKDSAIKYSAMGMEAFLSKPPPANKPKPNTRFLTNIIKSTSNHNAALLAKEAAESQARLRELKRKEENAKQEVKKQERLKVKDIRKRQLGAIAAHLGAGSEKAPRTGDRNKQNGKEKEKGAENQRDRRRSRSPEDKDALKEKRREERRRDDRRSRSPEDRDVRSEKHRSSRKKEERRSRSPVDRNTYSEKHRSSRKREDRRSRSPIDDGFHPERTRSSRREGGSLSSIDHGVHPELTRSTRIRREKRSRSSSDRDVRSEKHRSSRNREDKRSRSPSDRDIISDKPGSSWKREYGRLSPMRVSYPSASPVRTKHRHRHRSRSYSPSQSRRRHRSRSRSHSPSSSQWRFPSPKRHRRRRSPSNSRSRSPRNPSDKKSQSHHSYRSRSRLSAHQRPQSPTRRSPDSRLSHSPSYIDLPREDRRNYLKSSTRTESSRHRRESTTSMFKESDYSPDPPRDKMNKVKQESETQDEQDDSDPLEEIIGPLPPAVRHSNSPLLKRGRGIGSSKFGATMDDRFAANYDPSTDVQLDGNGNGGGVGDDDWDNALEAYRDRVKWKQQGAERLRAAGFTEEEVEKWATRKRGRDGDGDEGEIDGVKWTKKGGQREWDRGKVVRSDGEVGVAALWGELGGSGPGKKDA